MEESRSTSSKFLIVYCPTDNLVVSCEKGKYLKKLGDLEFEGYDTTNCMIVETVNNASRVDEVAQFYKDFYHEDKPVSGTLILRYSS